MKQLTFNVLPENGLADEPISVRIKGLNKQEKITLYMEITDNNNITWFSNTEYTSSDDGNILLDNLRSQIDMWNMSCYGDINWLMPTFKGTPFEIKFKLTRGTQVIEKKIQRNWIDNEITIENVEVGRVRGQLYLPKTDKKSPVIIILNGSSGGINPCLSGLLASMGYATFALGYFNYKDLPPMMINLPLEYFNEAITYLKSHDQLDSNRIGVYGVSYGGMLALILGSLYPDIKMVATNIPSAISFGGIGAPLEKIGCWQFLAYEQMYLGWNQQKQQAAFTLNSQPYHYLSWAPIPDSYVQLVSQLSMEQQGIPLLPMYLEAIDKASVDELESNMIKVEKINGPIYVATGKDDKLWPSYQSTLLMNDRLLEKSFKHHFEMHHYDGVGHILNTPYTPTPNHLSNFKLGGRHFEYDFGGNNKNQISFAMEDSWLKLKEFLKAHFPVNK